MSNSDGPVNDDACRIRREIEALKNDKIEIDRKISDLEALLRGLKSENEAAGDTDSNGFGHGLSPDLIYRHSRHLMLPSFGIQGQSKLSKSSVLVVGAGGLGSPALLYLAACGVGRIGIVDHDVVELNNLHRQVGETVALCIRYEPLKFNVFSPIKEVQCIQKFRNLIVTAMLQFEMHLRIKSIPNPYERKMDVNYFYHKRVATALGSEWDLFYQR
ncbi:hypothetical protein QQ045_020421 [Rhodiola kirilowii]